MSDNANKQRRRPPRKKYPVGRADLLPGERRLVEVNGRQIGVFNVAGSYFALHNRCPHMAGNLCAGIVTGTALPSADFVFTYGRQGEIIRCGWHGWEFEIATGRCLVDQRVRARTYPVIVENGQLYVAI